MKKKERQKLHCELKSYRSQGIILLLNGEESTPRRIEKACSIAETGEYMRDYIQDEEGRLQGLSFDYVRAL
ncbi:MAG TPA: hypothetical protein H9809_10930 [Candidatus Blautia pullicola]|jgi:hypothetical protein|uniref:Uncharacterized protein n=1 Tax=Candidatus Blautia pullicola TaxID=2838498 RepID=A0A9D2FSX5_9FIRM|nr:hypothetical protein [Candidatus Blautia pullicola]